MNGGDYRKVLQMCLEAVERWHAKAPVSEADSTTSLPFEKIEPVLEEYFDRLVESYPFYSPFYAGQMMKPPHPVAVAAYFAAMHINPNNHALDGGPATSSMEIEAVDELAQMFDFPQHLGHLTGGGTVANLEALWVAKNLHPDKAIAFSRQCHYTHPRLCEVIGARGIVIENDESGRMDLNDLEAKLKTENVGTVVATVGTTGLGAVDPVDELVLLKEKHGIRVHADAAYGGFFKLLADADEPLINPGPFRCLKDCDSIVIDPHKHGLQAYSCGCVIFADPAVGRFYRHDSPYTYFTSKDLHLGEISLECSRAGAAAAALWVTLKCFPLRTDEGFGPILAKCRKAAMEWSKLMKESGKFEMLVEPELDIVAYFPRADKASTASALSEKLFTAAMNHPEKPVWTAKMKISPPLLGDRFGKDFWDTPDMTVLRGVLMKPEHLDYVPEIVKRLVGHLEEIS